MNKLSVLFLVCISLIMPNYVSQVMAKKVVENRNGFPGILRLNKKVAKAWSEKSQLPDLSLNYNYQKVFFDQHKQFLALRRMRSFAHKYNMEKYNNNLNLIGIFTSLMATMVTRVNKISLAPAEMMKDSGLSYSLPLGQHFSAFATFRPSLLNAMTAPQTMVAAGLQIPVADTDEGQDLCLKWSTALDQENQPIFLLCLNLISMDH